MSLQYLDSLPERELLPGCKTRFYHSSEMTFAFWEIQKGSKLPSHSHPHEQVAQVLKGTLELIINGKTYTMNEGSIISIPPHAVHSAYAVEDVNVLDTFYPVRKDYL